MFNALSACLLLVKMADRRRCINLAMQIEEVQGKREIILCSLKVVGLCAYTDFC